MPTVQPSGTPRRVEPGHRHGLASVGDAFHAFSHRAADVVGSPWAFGVAVSDTWQLVINTATTIVTFLMVFVIQNTQNRDARAVHLKLDELIRGVRGARNRLVDLEELSEDELDALKKEFQRLQQRERAAATASKTAAE